MDRLLLKPPNNISKLTSVGAAICFLGALLGGAYGFSIHEKKVNADIFTISQALAFGNKYIMVIFFTLAFMGIIFLNFYRANTRFVYIRLALLLIVYGLLITIIWVTTYLNERLHYIFAGIIFTTNLIYIALLTYEYQKYLKNKKSYKTTLLDLNLMLAFAALTILLTFGIFEADDSSRLDDSLFAGTENLTVLLTATTLLFLGFI